MKITVEMAARILNKSKPFVRIGLQRNLLPFGFAMQKNPERRRSRYDYFINPKQFADYIGLTVSELEVKVREVSA